MRQFSISPKAIRVWKIELYFLLIVFSVLSGFFFAVYRPLGVIFEAAVLAAFFTAWLFYLPRRLRRHRITLNENAVMVQRGVFIRMTYVMPYPRLIYAQRYSTPLGRLFGLAGIRLKAARGALTLPLLEESDLKAILDLLSG